MARRSHGWTIAATPALFLITGTDALTSAPIAATAAASTTTALSAADANHHPVRRRLPARRPRPDDAIQQLTPRPTWPKNGDRRANTGCLSMSKNNTTQRLRRRALLGALAEFRLNNRYTALQVTSSSRLLTCTTPDNSISCVTFIKLPLQLFSSRSQARSIRPITYCCAHLVKLH